MSRRYTLLVLWAGLSWYALPQFCGAQSLRSGVVSEAVDDVQEEVLVGGKDRRLGLFGKKNDEDAKEVVKEVLEQDGGDKKKKKKDKDEKDKKKKDKKKNDKETTEDELPIIEDGYFDEGDDEDEGEAAPVHAAPPKKMPPENIAGDKRTVENLSMSFQMAKARLVESLKHDYGEDNFETLWMDDNPRWAMPNNETTRCTMGRNAFQKGSTSSRKSWYRTVRKMKINVLQYLLSGDVQDFVWATAGNSDAAGHGNFFGQQYTMVMQERAKDLFHSVGLDLVARPYGIGGATSAPEIAGCAEEIFGTDVDMMTWDFAMTDGRWYWRMEFFAHRVAIMKNHPVLLVLQPGTEPKRQAIVDHLTQQGMGVLRQDEKYVIDRQLQFPDSRYRTDEELAAMPENVRWFRCGYGVEFGPGCLDNKFTHNGTCDERSYRTNWHHGWKWHAFHGNLYALFLMEVLEDALYDLGKEQGDLRELYDKLTKEEYKNFQTFEEGAKFRYEHPWTMKDVNAMQLMRDRTYCHTALLPAQTRYLGYVFNKNSYDDWFSYNKGYQLKAISSKPKPKMHLTYIPRSRNDKCEAPLNIDSRDFFLADHAFHGYQRVVIPNDAEVAAYGDYATSGIIMVCAAACSFECKGSPLLSPDIIDKGNKAKFRVNGEDVATVVRMDNCFVFEREDGTLMWPQNSKGKYEIEVHTLAKYKHFRFTSFIVW